MFLISLLIFLKSLLIWLTTSLAALYLLALPKPIVPVIGVPAPAAAALPAAPAAPAAPPEPAAPPAAATAPLTNIPINFCYKLLFFTCNYVNYKYKITLFFVLIL